MELLIDTNDTANYFLSITWSRFVRFVLKKLFQGCSNYFWQGTEISDGYRGLNVFKLATDKLLVTEKPAVGTEK